MGKRTSMKKPYVIRFKSIGHFQRAQKKRKTNKQKHTHTHKKAKDRILSGFGDIYKNREKKNNFVDCIDLKKKSDKQISSQSFHKDRISS